MEDGCEDEGSGGIRWEGMTGVTKSGETQEPCGVQSLSINN